MADLIILGNGFDLNVGMKTKYSNYFCKVDTDSEVGKLCKALDGMENSPFKDIELCKEVHQKVTFWNIIFYVLKGADIKNWSDVENTISEIV